MSVEMVFAVIAAVGAVTGICLNLWTTHRKGVDDEAKKNERAITTENQVNIIYSDVKDIKAEVKAINVLQTEHRMAISDHERRLNILEKKVID